MANAVKKVSGKVKKPAKRAPAKKATKSKVKLTTAGPKAKRHSDMSMYCARTDLGAPADVYFEEVGPALKDLAAMIRAIVKKAAPAAKESLKWGMPVYDQDGLVCYVRAASTYVVLGFYHEGVNLPDPAGRLEGAGVKMRHVKLRTKADIDAGLFARWVKQAAESNASR